MNISTPIGTEITAVNFGFYSAQDVERFSVKQIVNPTVFDNLGHPTRGGLYDLALGPFLGKSMYVLAWCSTSNL
jgi:DNA-directed RNA polymerase I subunit RPA1